MADKNEESEIIKLLLNVEKEASLLIDDALIKAEQKITEAKTAANTDFQNRYNQMIQELETDYNNQVQKIQTNHESIINEFKSSLENKKQNKEKFFTFVDSVFFNPESK